jgi:hypothetical protein
MAKTRKSRHVVEEWWGVCSKSWDYTRVIQLLCDVIDKLNAVDVLEELLRSHAKHDADPE